MAYIGSFSPYLHFYHSPQCPRQPRVKYSLGSMSVKRDLEALKRSCAVAATKAAADNDHMRSFKDRVGFAKDGHFELKR